MSISLLCSNKWTKCTEQVLEREFSGCGPAVFNAKGPIKHRKIGFKTAHVNTK